MRLAVCLVCCLAAPVSAQQVLHTIDKATLPHGIGEGTTQPAELDGLASTPEWLQWRQRAGEPMQLRGLALRQGAWCLGDWIDPLAYVTWLPGDQIVVPVVLEVQGKHALVLLGDVRLYRVVEIGYGCE